MKTLIHKDICTPVFIDTPFTIAKTWKEPRAHQHIHTDWLKKMWCIYIYKGIIHSHKKNEMLPFATTWVDLENIILSEVSQTEKYKYYMISLIQGI